MLAPHNVTPVFHRVYVRKVRVSERVEAILSNGVKYSGQVAPRGRLSGEWHVCLVGCILGWVEDVVYISTL